MGRPAVLPVGVALIIKVILYPNLDSGLLLFSAHFMMKHPMNIKINKLQVFKGKGYTIPFRLVTKLQSHLS